MNQLHGTGERQTRDMVLPPPPLPPTRHVQVIHMSESVGCPRYKQAQLQCLNALNDCASVHPTRLQHRVFASAAFVCTLASSSAQLVQSAACVG